MRLFPLGKNYNSKKKILSDCQDYAKACWHSTKRLLFLSHAIFTDWWWSCDSRDADLCIFPNTVFTWSILRGCLGARRLAGTLNDSQFDFEYFQAKYLVEISTIQQQVDRTAVRKNEVCFKYCPRCNKFLFLPFIRPITAQDSQGGIWARTSATVKGTKTVVPFPVHCCPTSYKCVSSSSSSGNQK